MVALGVRNSPSTWNRACRKSGGYCGPVAGSWYWNSVSHASHWSGPVYNLMKFVTPNMGKVVFRNRDAYRYLDESIRKFPEGKAFTAILGSTGYRNTYCKPLSLGICSILLREKIVYTIRVMPGMSVWLACQISSGGYQPADHDDKPLSFRHHAGA